MTLRAGTRGSLLAWTQANWAIRLIEELDSRLGSELVRIDTRGDLDQHTPLATLPGTGLFVKELEAALLRREIDLAIHSLKDVPFDTAAGCRLFFLSREDPRDALVSPHGGIASLPQGALVGTGSPRRIAQLRFARPDLRFADLRGNLDTRLRKLSEGSYDAIVLACAGLSRLGWSDRITERIDPDTCLPAFGQGVLALECREDSTELAARLSAICDPVTESVASAERELMRALGGGCKTAMAALAEPSPSGMLLRGVVGDHSNGKLVRERWEGPVADSLAAAREMAIRLRARASREEIHID